MLKSESQFSLSHVAKMDKKLSYCWLSYVTVRRESMPRIAEMDVKMTTLAEMTFKCTSRSSKWHQSKASV